MHMDHQKAMDILSGRAGGPAAACLRAGLWAASKPYAAAMRLRRWAYRAGVARSHAAGVPVICVGNLTTGGTGKTPMVAWVVGQLQQAGHRPAILTRGYGGQVSSSAGDVGGGAGDDLAGSDEARLLAGLTGAGVIVDGDRVAGAARAVADGADVLVMDDGFQHRRLRRDLDIVLIDAVSPFGLGHCLPRGLLREGPSALADAHAVVVTHADQAPLDQLARLSDRLRVLAPRASHHAAVHVPKALLDESGARRPLGELLGRPVLAFAGLAAPGHFFATLERLGAHLAARHALPDHAVYTQAILDELTAAATAAKADVLVTTQKDHVKLAVLHGSMPICQLAVEIDITDGRESLLARILDVAAGKRLARS
jgi:tetraacyldisaccharide 4'-kinase